MTHSNPVKKRRLCFVTSTRADYGHLKPLLKKTLQDPDIEFQLIALAMHLAPEFGNTLQNIVDDNIPVSDTIDCLNAGDSAQSIANTSALTLIQATKSLVRLSPDLLVVFGDRYEMWSVAQAGLFLGLPIAHIAGGDLSEGAYDDAIRHSLTKMSHLHFPTNRESRRRIIQMGESSKNVVDVGSLGIDAIKETDLYDRETVANKLNLDLNKPVYLATFHPATLDAEAGKREWEQFELALKIILQQDTRLQIVLTKPSLDIGSRDIHQAMDKLNELAQCFVFSNLGSRLYLSLLQYCNLVLGNSSSGIYEVPSFNIPTVNIGTRQLGRLQASSVVQCDAQCDAIITAVQKAKQLDCANVVNPYGDGGAADRILTTIKSVDDFKSLRHKHFRFIENLPLQESA